MFQTTKKIVLYIASICLLFFALVFFQNHTSMVVTMSTPSNTQLQSQIYFTSEGEPFSEVKSRKSFKVKNNQYYFSLPDLKTIQYARFDPHNKIIDNITIHKTIFIQSEWFKTTLSTIEIKNVKPLNHIKDYKITKDGIQFSSINNDPQLNVGFLITPVSFSKILHLNLFILSILIVLVLSYLYQLAKTKELDSALTTKLILYSLFFAFVLFKVNYYKENIKFTYPPDELAHLSYINHLHTHNDLLPKFETMVMINNKTAGNYLGHPPLYYHIMDFVYDSNYSIVHNVDNFRALSMMIFIASFILLLYLGFSAKLSLLGHLVYLTFISSVPMYAYIGASISNDTLAIFGGLLFIVALKKLLDKEYTNLTYFILSLGIFVAYFSKLTAAILIFFISIYFFIYIFTSKTNFKISKIQIILLLLTVLPVLSYQLYIYSNYHTLLPGLHITYPEQYLQSGFYVPEEFRQHLSYGEWLERMKNSIIGGWFGIHSHHSFTKDSIFGYLGLLILHIFAMMTLFFTCDKNNKSYCLLGKLALLSLFSVLLIQFLFSYQTHLKSGYLGGLQPRYVLPFMFSFAIMSSLFVERFKTFFLFQVIVILLCIHTLYSDFFYFLNYYT